MEDRRVTKASLVGRVIEDVSLAALAPARYQAEMVGHSQDPFYKEGGYFVFTGLRPGAWRLRLSGEGFQTQEQDITIPTPQPWPAPLPGQAGENELLVIVRSFKAVNGHTRITFDPVWLNRRIPAGVNVLGDGLITQLAAPLEAGRVAEARLVSGAGLADDKIVRIIPEPSFRLRFSPYYRFAVEPSRVVGRVVPQVRPDEALSGARIRVKKINDSAVDLKDVAGLDVATVVLGGKKQIPGAAQDLLTRSNENGDYNLYFPQALFNAEPLKSLTLEIQATGFKSAETDVSFLTGARQRADFQLEAV